MKEKDLPRSATHSAIRNSDALAVKSPQFAGNIPFERIPKPTIFDEF
jgi:hypothetical protein